MKPLVDLLCFPDELVQLSAALALNALTLGTESMCKAAVLTDGGIEALLAIINDYRLQGGPPTTSMSKTGQLVATVPNKDIAISPTRRQLNNAVIYALGSICEHDEVKMKFVELSGITSIVRQSQIGDMDMKRACGYCLATISEQVRFTSSINPPSITNPLVSSAVPLD